MCSGKHAAGKSEELQRWAQPVEKSWGLTLESQLSRVGGGGGGALGKVEVQGKGNWEGEASQGR